MKQIVNEFIELDFKESSVVVKILDTTIELKRESSIYVKRLEDKADEEFGLGLAFEAVASDPRESLPVVFLYFVSKDSNLYSIIPLTSIRRLGTASTSIYLFKYLESDPKKVLEALKIVTLMGGLRIQDIPLSKPIEFAFRNYLLSRYPDALKMILRAKMTKLNKKFYESLDPILDMIIEQLTKEIDLEGYSVQPSSHIVAQIKRIADRLSNKGEITKYIEGKPILALGTITEVKGIPFLILVALYFSDKTNIVFYFLPALNLPSEEEIIENYKKLFETKEPISIGYYSPKGEFKQLKIPAPLEQSILHRLYDFDFINKLEENLK